MRQARKNDLVSLAKTPVRWSLGDGWQLRVEGANLWQDVQVPGCWEEVGIAKDAPGPVWYKREISVPGAWQGKRVWLCFGAVSYNAVIYLNDQEIGRHTGAWDSFAFDLTPFLQVGETAELRVHIEKPASLERGPASKPVPGHFPLKETLAGFLPYVWGHLFGGIWQDVWLEARGEVSVEEAFIHTDANGSFTASLKLSHVAACTLELLSPEGEVVTQLMGEGRELYLAGHVEQARAWSLENPVLYEARVLINDETVHSWRFGFRSFETKDTTLYLNDVPIYPRMALSWGWYAEVLHSNPGRERVRAELLRLKSFGYNGVKLCLWVPPDYFFELADELGMLLWLELPMWLPKVTPFFKTQTPLEYDRIIRQVRQHPSLIIYSLGCELNREVGSEMLEPLYRHVKALIGEALLRDNSGSGEAYGGLLNEFAEYYDYHFYSDIQFLGELIDTFTPRWRPVQPWLFGEFCDSDTFRDLRKLYAANTEKPWWTSNDAALNPQGARWQYDLPFQEERLKENGFWERGEELERISNHQALLHRKFTLELVRSYREISGYVVTGERDTPISTAGMWDDLGRDKFPPTSFKTFNDDLVLLLGWDKRRAWVNGGDRAAHWDTFSYSAGAKVRAHLIASNYSGSNGTGRLTWQAKTITGEIIAAGERAVEITLGVVRELAIAEFEMPQVTRPERLLLQAELTLGNTRTHNTWSLWCFPSDPWQKVKSFRLFDPENRLAGLSDLVRLETDPSASVVVLSTTWNKELEAFIREGGRAILLTNGNHAEPFATSPMPFWREAIKVLEPHAAWGDFPHEGWTDLQFYGLATDVGLETFKASGCRPILRRLDARTMAVHDYAAEVPLGKGTLIVSTLRFEGKLGRQPVGIKRNTAAAYLLSCWLRYLQAS
jgi:hypothetical protein